MSGRIDAERILDVYLAPEADQLADRVIDAALADIARTPQRRALGVPWRFLPMPAIARTAGIAAAALVVVVGAGGLITYLGANAPGGGGGSALPTDSPPPTLPPGIPGWTSYTSPVYDLTMAYPSDWAVFQAAEHAWQPGEPAPSDAWPWADVFVSPATEGAEEIGMWVWQVPAPEGADLGSWDGLEAAFLAICEEPTFGGSCDVASPPTPMCHETQGRDGAGGTRECRPALILSVGTDEISPSGVIGDPETATVTVFSMGREDDFPAAAKYGGTVALLKAILSQVDVRDPQPGETPQP